MSEFRQNIITQEWVIISAERSNKPKGIKEQVVKTDINIPEYDINCPFCPGNEKKFEIIETYNVKDNGSDWSVRSIENKYKILANYDTCPIQPSRFENNGIYMKYDGCGLHEVVIETPYHNEIIPKMTKKQVEDIISAYYNRHIEFGKIKNNLITIIFKNHGVKAGASQPHAHSQIVASRIVPLNTRYMLFETQKYFDSKGICVFCEVLEFELKEEKRIIYENKLFVSLVPYAAAEPHEVWIIPKIHNADFNRTTEEERSYFADALQNILIKFYHAFNNPDFNYVIYNAPYHLSDVPFFHWYMRLIPRIKIAAGFEIGTRIGVNTVYPEESAKILRDSLCYINL